MEDTRMTNQEAETLKSGKSHINVRLQGRTYIGLYKGVRIVRRKPMLLVEIDGINHEIPPPDADLIAAAYVPARPDTAEPSGRRWSLPPDPCGMW